MEQFDRQKAARVWQRVQESKPLQKQDRMENLQELIMNEELEAAAYRQLARQLQPKDGAVLQRLAREEQRHGACLRGMHRLVTEDRYEPHSPQLPKEPPERTLRRCYGQTLRSLRAYEEKCDDPEYGPVFTWLAAQEREHCAVLLELIGGLGIK